LIRRVQYERKADAMAEPRDARKQVEHLIERAQDDILDANRGLAGGITRGTDRFVRPVFSDLERVLDIAFDFAERVLRGQRKILNDVATTISEQRDRAADMGRTTTQKAMERATAKRPHTMKPSAKKAPAQRAPARKRAATKVSVK
jgi:hypothetical protein